MRPGGEEDRADHAECQWNLDQGFSSLVLDCDTTDVPLMHELLDRRDQLLSADREFFFANFLLTHDSSSLVGDIRDQQWR